MRRGEFYLVRSPRDDVRSARVFLVVSRQRFINSSYSTVICLPVYTRAEGVSTEVPVGPAEGMKHASVIRCDGITSVAKTALTTFVGVLAPSRFRELNRALALALDIARDDIEGL